MTQWYRLTLDLGQELRTRWVRDPDVDPELNAWHGIDPEGMHRYWGCETRFDLVEVGERENLPNRVKEQLSLTDDVFGVSV